MKLDLGCGKAKREGFHGVDRLPFAGVDEVWDLTSPWPWADGSIEEAYSGHFVEHLNSLERIHFFNELGRVLKVGGTAQIVVPHWSNACAYGDPTHQWPPLSEWAAYYLNKAWREQNAPHVLYSCDFDFVTGVRFDDRVAGWNDDRRVFGANHHINASRDLFLNLTKRAP